MMKKMSYFMLIIMFLSSCLLFFKPSEASACSCAGPESVDEALKSKTAIFAGKVIKITEPKTITSSADPISVLFDVKSTWKGVKQTQVIVTTAMDSASCGANFTVGKEFIVYAYGKKGQLETGLCTRTKSLEVANEDLRLLGMGKVPTENVHLEISETETSHLGWIIGGGILILVFVVSGVIYFLQFRMKNKKN